MSPLPETATVTAATELGTDEGTVARARELHEASLVINASGVVERADRHFDKARAGGVTALNHTVTIPDVDLEVALNQINLFRRWLDDHQDKGLLCTTVADIYEAKTSAREAIILGPQDSLFLGTQLSRLGTFYDLGVRILQLTYQKRNWVGDGCGEPNPAGLSSFGKALVREMDEMGVLVDLSHCSAPTSYDAIETARGPVVLTHAHPNAVTPHLRAKDDNLLKAIADAGGVVGVTALSAFNRLERGVRPGLAEVIHHIDYLVNLIGEDHVGIGMDYDETNTPEKHAADIARNPELEPNPEFAWDDRRVRHLSDSDQMGNITLALLTLGYSDETITKILGTNFLRVFKQVWRD